ncbi:MAG: hypothetical protein M3456_03340 [Actinomycetota bacterium]|nr:hypothetical protein [Actinomycetota bacterium]
MAQARGDPIRFTDLVRDKVREHRTARGWTREDLAGSARQLGLDWTEGTVRHLEDGSRGVGDDLLALLLIFRVGLGDFLGTDGHPVLIGHYRLERPAELAEIVDGTFFTSGLALERSLPLQGQQDRFRAADQKAARALGVSVSALNEASHRLWKWYLSDEREFRLEAAIGDREVSPRSRQALRGHITRKLLDELRDVLEDKDVGGGDG